MNNTSTSDSKYVLHLECLCSVKSGTIKVPECLLYWSPLALACQSDNSKTVIFFKIEFHILFENSKKGRNSVDIKLLVKYYFFTEKQLL